MEAAEILEVREILGDEMEREVTVEDIEKLFEIFVSDRTFQARKETVDNQFREFANAVTGFRDALKDNNRIMEAMDGRFDQLANMYNGMDKRVTLIEACHKAQEKTYKRWIMGAALLVSIISLIAPNFIKIIKYLHSLA